jgi:uncharacterized membrane protein YgaE (UPF0421/DUF939 family)
MPAMPGAIARGERLALRGARDAVRRWRRAGIPIVQAALAAGLAWWVAVHVVNPRVPFFAPIAAVVCLGIAMGQRPRRGIELVLGVCIGIGAGDLLIAHIGTGPWQITVLVALAMSAAILLDGGPVVAVQAAVSAVLVATLYSPSLNNGVSRMVDALIGSAVGLLVANLLPPDPLSLAHRDTGRVLGELARALRGTVRAIRNGDASEAAAVLDRVRKTQRMIDDLRTTLQAAEEIAPIAPIHWRRRPQLRRYLAPNEPVDHALRDTRVLIRRAATALRDREAMRPALCEALDQLADAVDLLFAELAEGREPVESRRHMLRIARLAGDDLDGGEGFSARVVVAQLRSALVDLLQATGMGTDAALAALPAHHQVPGRR